jgi:CheY-like chemotaxis protein
MAKNLCPSCERPNALSARFCSACGTVLIARCPQCAARNEATNTQCIDCGASMKAAARGRRPGVAAAKSTASPARKRSAASAGPPVASGGEELKIVLLDIGDPPPDPRANQPARPELIRSDPEAPMPALAVLTEVVGDLLPEPAAAAPGAKAARRAAVRRAVQARSAPEPDFASSMNDVLVIDANEFARTQLCSVLESFGFRAHAAAGHEEAADLLDVLAFNAVFIDTVLEGSEAATAAEICQLVKAQPLPGGRAVALIIVASMARPADRVRATLVGADEFLVKPLQRGHIARALEACGVALPSDPRRA